MASSRSPLVHDHGGGASRYLLGSAALAFLFALGACSPVATYRNLTGASKNDPNPATTPNAKNLAAGEASPYPNLATVPPPPTQELTEAELQHLTQSLVADRANAKYSDQQLRAGFAEEGTRSPVSATAAATSPGDVASEASPVSEMSPTSRPAAKPRARAASPAAAAALAAAGPVPPAGVASGAPQPPEPTTAVAAAGPDAPTPGAASGMESGLRKPGQPPLPGPMESRLVSPQIRETPQPGQPQPAPPPPRIVSLPAGTGGGAAHLPPPPAQAAMPPTGAVAYQPPPPPPVLVSPVTTRTAMAAPVGKKAAPPVPTATPIANITFAAGSVSLSDSDVAALDRVAALYRQDPGNLRVVGYAGVGNSTTDPLSSFRAALDHAQAVAAALAKTGIPADKIAVEASPAKGAAGADHAEVLLLR